MKLRLIFILLTFLFNSNGAHSQKEGRIQRKNIVHLEAGGMGGYGSLNYERIFSLPGLFSASGRIGFSTIRIFDYTNRFNPDLLFPIAVNGFFGKVHKLHLGFGQLIANTTRSNITNGTPKRVTNLHTHFAIGYRYQKNDGKLIFGISYTPMIEFQETYRNWGAMTIGYAF
jgi:hypothetical protein